MTETRALGIRAPRKAVALDVDRFKALAAKEGWESYVEIGDALGLSDNQVKRIVTGKAPVSAAFIGGLLLAVDELGFRRVFTPVTATKKTRKEG